MSDGDELLEEVAAALRARDPEAEAAQRAEWEAWERLAAGEDDEALTDPERREAFAPMDDATLEALTAAAAGALSGTTSDKVAETMSATDATDEAPPARPPAEVVPIGRGRRAWIAGGVVLAAAAAVLFLVLRPQTDAGALDGYTLQLTAGDRELRSEGAAAPEATLSPGSRVEIVLRPETERAPPEVRCFLVADGARAPWDPPVERSARGAIRIAGTARALFGERVGPVAVEIELGDDDDARTFRAELRLERDP